MQTDYPETYSLSMSASSFDDAFTPSMVHDSGFVPSRAATPEPCSPRSRSLQLRQDSDLSTRPAFNPYSVYESTSTRRRSQASKASPPKRSLVSFLFFRRAFPQLYPVIDRLEKQQGAKSAIIGSIWRRLPDEQREPFFRMQQRSAEEFRIAQGLPLDAPRADPIKTLMRRDRARQRRAADDKLSPRSELIVSLWEQNIPDDDIIRAVEAFDAKHGTSMKGKSETKQTKGKPSAPLANQTNTTAAEVEALPSTPVLHVAVQLPDYAPTPSLSDSFSTPATSPSATSPVIRTPSPDTSNPVYFALPPCLPAGLDVPFVLPANHMSSNVSHQPCGDFQSYMPASENWNRMIAPVSAPLVPPYQPWSHIDPKLTVNANLLSAPCEHAPTLYDSVAVPSCSTEYFQSFGIQPAAPFEHPFEHALGSQEELAGLAAYDAANVAPNFGDLFESFVEVSCMPY